MNTLLLIGGSGFFGKSILDAYLRGALNPWGVSRIHIMSRSAETLKKSNPELMDSSINLINADISKCNFLPDANFIIHAAASTNVTRYFSNSESEKLNIISGTFNYCKLAKIYHKNSQILYVSSGAVYGQQPISINGFGEDDDLMPIESLPKHKQDYAAAKRDSERLILNLQKSGICVSVARCFSFMGKYLPRDQHFAIGNFIEDALNKRDVKVSANSCVYRSYMHADDLVKWLMKIVSAGYMFNPVFNVGSRYPIEIGDLAKMVASLAGVAVNISTDRVNAVDMYIPNTKKAENLLGLKCSIDLTEGLNKVINDLSINK